MTNVTENITDEMRAEMEQLAALLHKHKERIAVLSPDRTIGFGVKNLVHAIQDAAILIQCEDVER